MRHTPPTATADGAQACCCPACAQFGFGARFYLDAFAAAAHYATNMDTLVALGTSVAYFYSLCSVASCALQAHHGSVACNDPQQFETAAMLITFILLGKFLEASAKGKASEAIEALLQLQPPTALRVDCITDVDDAPQEVAVSELSQGDVVKILPGAQVADVTGVTGVRLPGVTGVTGVTGRRCPFGRLPAHAPAPAHAPKPLSAPFAPVRHRPPPQ